MSTSRAGSGRGEWLSYGRWQQGPDTPRGKCWPRSAERLSTARLYAPLSYSRGRLELTPLSRTAEGRDWALMYLRGERTGCGVDLVIQELRRSARHVRARN